jgi:hypothetical protein
MKSAQKWVNLHAKYLKVNKEKGEGGREKCSSMEAKVQESFLEYRST